ncbi:Protein of unknown function [Cotesia congregata]|uniref:Uncharacterized protein n=1 Tax=Cotesia congregata TaxID=51543 RepID=A0A8J2H8D9_COTCN|nr:Protein of unknown function [Cotesia congregata]
MDAILRQSHITPGKNYTYQKISKAVSKSISGKYVKIICVPSKNMTEPGKQILRSIGFYMDKNFKPTDPTDIDSPFDGYFTCDRERVIFYQGLMDFVADERKFQQSIRSIY